MVPTRRHQYVSQEKLDYGKQEEHRFAEQERIDPYP
jgi:hypothetical protein